MRVVRVMRLGLLGVVEMIRGCRGGGRSGCSRGHGRRVLLLLLLHLLASRNGRRMVERRGGRKLMIVTLVGGRRVEAGNLLIATGANPILLLVFHAPILEPNLDLALGERQIVRYFNAAPARQVLVVVELLLQLQRLVARIGLARSLIARAGFWLLHPGINVPIVALGLLDLVHLFLVFVFLFFVFFFSAASSARF